MKKEKEFCTLVLTGTMCVKTPERKGKIYIVKGINLNF